MTEIQRVQRLLENSVCHEDTGQRWDEICQRQPPHNSLSRENPDHSCSSLTNLSSLRNSVLHDASHVGYREINVLLPEVLFDTAVIMVIQICICIVYGQQTQRMNQLCVA